MCYHVCIMPHVNDDLTLSKSDSWRMFDDISPRYDFLNHLLSLGLDISWRRRLATLLPKRKGQRILDVATGTADVLLALIKNPNVQACFGVDMAEKMLAIARAKVARLGFEDRILLQHGDANQIPFNDNTFDAVTSAFGIRNMADPNQVLGEMRRVLNSGGRALILEFSLPGNKILRAAHLFYLRSVVPAIGGLISGHGAAYRYLNQTIERFSCGAAFCAIMTDAGLRNATAHPLCGGIATIYAGEK